MSRNPVFIAWDAAFADASLAIRQQRYAQALAVLRPLIGDAARKAKQWPPYRHALAGYALALYRHGEVNEALLQQSRLLLLTPNDAEARGNLLLLLQTQAIEFPDSAEFRRVLHGVLSQTELSDYAVPACRALLADAAFRQALQRLRGDDAELITALRQGRLRPLLQAPLLQLLLRNTLIPLPDFELALRRLRKALLMHYTADPHRPPQTGKADWDFIAALAQYQWLTEYAYAEDPEESQRLAALALQLQAGRDRPAEPAWQAALTYFALYRSGLELADSRSLFCQSAVSWKPHLQALVREWQACLHERTLAATVERLTDIADPVSEQVRRQYEEHPFPRWRQDPQARQVQSAGQWLRGLAPDLALSADFDGDIAVLTAGCGTGLEPISLTRQIRIGRYLALDLSRASLSYALRMAGELGLRDRIDFKQADLTRLDGYPERFDLITASGVLHHLAEPLHGWRILCNLLKPGGVMLVSLYSEAARRPVDAARQLIAANGWQAEPDRMRQLRQAILAGDYPELAPLLQWRDFYNLGMFRDLVFHACEHRYTLPQIAAQLRQLNLRFIAMRGLPPALNALYHADYPHDPNGSDLANWASFEARHPNAFRSMYGLLLQKPPP
ncbi:hypothetical protein BJL95_02705 [Methylomonas sp. LWB]|uniref:class I SAM-dependent methyltransferase n=1 Tax=Methylomonas sp. LWB TaxID=1905845 RepID=UPI0008DA7FB4|nr:class I SAM-dependent methyltransferase [Methylomonas sp. LWB]OHX35969.1 hypothetical protein BJL95_02705 [Methylomonas sp. LWB]